MQQPFWGEWAVINFVFDFTIRTNIEANHTHMATNQLNGCVLTLKAIMYYVKVEVGVWSRGQALMRSKKSSLPGLKGTELQSFKVIHLW